MAIDRVEARQEQLNDQSPGSGGSPSAIGFDNVFSHAAASDALHEVLRAGLSDLPDWVESYNFVPAAGLVEVAAALAVMPDGLVLDLACGLGGPGLLVMERVAACVVGLDWSRVACRRALVVARSRGSEAAYVTASGNAVPLASASVDAAMCIDALRFIPGYGTRELRRVLKPTARLVITAWERDDDDALGVAIPSFATLLRDAGFRIIASEQRPEWLDVQRAVYHAARKSAAATAADPAVVGLAEEGERVLPLLPTMRRVFVVAEAPESS